MSKVLEMRPCKECGKMFMPKSAMQQYCDAPHYRPCPVCGKLVLAKYLSDPARRCDACKHSKSVKSVSTVKNSNDLAFQYAKADVENLEKIISDNEDNIPASEEHVIITEIEDVGEGQDIATDRNLFTMEELIDNAVIVEYVGVKASGFIPNHKYIIKVAKSRYGYSIEAIQDITEQELKEISISVSSMTSINQNFKRTTI